MNEQNSLFQEPRESRPNQATTPDASSSADAANDLGTRVETLQQQLTTVLILLLIVSATFAIYLYPQVTAARRQLDVAHQVLADYNQHTAPAIKKFVGQLGEYAKAHPEVLPILAKYGLTKPASASTNAPIAPPASGQ